MSFPKAFSDLRQAVEINDISRVRELLATNLELLNHVDFKEAKSWILTEVASSQNLEITQLIVNVIKIGPKDSLKRHLETAIQKGNWKFAEYLIQSGISLAPSKFKDNSLARHVFKRDIIDTRKDMLVVLLNYGLLDPRTRNQKKETLLLQFIDERGKNIEKDDANAIEIAKVLLDAGVRINKCDNKGYSALLRSISTRNVPLITYLIERGADVNRTDFEQRSPLLMALFWSLDIKLIDLILSKGAAVNVIYKLDFSTPLHAACNGDYEQAIRLLLNYGADISAINGEGKTPLFLSLSCKYLNLNRSVITLIKEFAKLKFKNMVISSRDMKLIQENPKALGHFDKCTLELNLMKNTKFHASHSFYSLLNNSIDKKKLSILTKNEELVLKFKKNLSRLTYYQNDLQRIWEEAIQLREKPEAAESRLYSIFGEHFPEINISN